MVFVPIIHQPALLQTRHSRELERRFDDVVREYKRLNPELTDAEVQSALTLSMQKVQSPEQEARQGRVAIMVVVSIVTAFAGAVFVSAQSKGGDNETVQIVAIVAVVAAIAIAAIRLARRD